MLDLVVILVSLIFMKIGKGDFSIYFQKVLKQEPQKE